MWAEVHDQTDRPHYGLEFPWLESWAGVYRPRKLALVTVQHHGQAAAVGLLELRPFGIWRFAGGGVTPHRRLVTLPGTEGLAWSAFGRWLEAQPRQWSLLEGRGAQASADGLPDCRLAAEPEFALRLPSAFDEYLAARSSGSRRGLKQKLRRLSAAGASVRAVEPASHPAALARFVELHRSRAAQKGERHPDIEERLCRLLLSLPESGPIRLRVFELTDRERVAGVSIRLDHRGTGYFYNAGIDPASASLSPGICLELASIEDAIGCGLNTFDLGPGAYRYKRDLGGEIQETHRVLAASRSARASVLRAGLVVRRAARRAATAATTGERR